MGKHRSRVISFVNGTKKIASRYSQEKKNVNLLLIIVPSKFRIKGFFFCLFVIFFLYSRFYDYEGGSNTYSVS